ncbi:MAG: hypothetical protein JO319_22130 [Acidobacteriaceae bacterium]|nr:hypothetical protein [Acidobacteriaceae bacterium]
MPRNLTDTPARRRAEKESKKRRIRSKAAPSRRAKFGPVWSAAALLSGLLLVWLTCELHRQYTVGLQSPVRLRFQWPLVIALRTRSEEAYQAQLDQRHALTPYQQYACRKFGSACRVALAIQRAENPQGKCEIYHYNTDGTLDWGYFQINTIHLKRPGLNLRDLLDCKANILCL